MATSFTKDDIVNRIIKTYRLEIENPSAYKKELRRMNYRKIGRPYRFTNSFIKFCAFLKEIFSFTYRKLSIVVESMTGIKISKTQLHYRINKLNIDFGFVKQLLKNKKLELVVDSTGFKPSNRGEWKIIKHENGIIKERNGYIKLSIVVDNHGLIFSVVFGDSNLHDVELFEEHLRDIEGLKERNVKITSLYGDGAYDTYRIFRKLRELGIKPVIKPRKNGKINFSKKDNHLYMKRDVYLKEIREEGYEEWKNKHKYGKRWIVESVFSVLKRMNNEVIKSRKTKYIEKEIERLIWVYNRIRVEMIKIKEGAKIKFYLVVELADRPIYFKAGIV